MVDTPNPNFGFAEASPGFRDSFAYDEDRARLSPVAIKAMKGIADKLGLAGVG